MELTLELSQHKWPPAETLGELFDANLPAMLALPTAALFGGVRCAAYYTTWPDASCHNLSSMPPPPATLCLGCSIAEKQPFG